MEKLTTILYKTDNTIFRTSDLALLLRESNYERLKSKLSYYSKKGIIKRLRKGIYAKPDYNQFELANKIYTPSYISLETILTKEGVIFQYFNTIFVISYLTREIQVDGKSIQIRKIKNNILINNTGIINEKNYFIATKERAFLDILYLYKDYYFDNLHAIDKKEVFNMLEIYQSDSLKKRVEKLLI